jgi:hypothetical protein
MSSQPQKTSLIGAEGIDHIVICSFERHSGIAADWGTVIDEELEIGRAERAAIVEELFLNLMPDYEWTAQDMTFLQQVETVEEFICFFEGKCDDQGAPKEKKTFKFNF